MIRTVNNTSIVLQQHISTFQGSAALNDLLSAEFHVVSPAAASAACTPGASCPCKGEEAQQPAGASIIQAAAADDAAGGARRALCSDSAAATSGSRRVLLQADDASALTAVDTSCTPALFANFLGAGQFDCGRCFLLS